ncbi:hypothetical protein SAY87_019632 [Trapa incisa]|uniref:Trehalose 6-phosphate phosphatase n=1 Tax=Trapa incisa TaxID=236973 RepID=A0AAN7K554_9MYRT|nr:hypothetical protein SAY87_019632 [Trapa incisa]
MVKQNLLISDGKLGGGLAISLEILGADTCLEISSSSSRRKLMKSESQPGGKVATFLASMRDSSPTRFRDTTDQFGTDERISWVVRHPSALALGMFDQIVHASRGKQIVMFLDYDGTLSPIVEDPDRAFMSEEMREAVKDTAKYFPTAIVSGRCRDKVYSFVRLAGLIYAGSHGMDIKFRDQKSRGEAVSFQPASEYLPMIDEVYQILLEMMESIPGAKVETNKYCLAVHFRCVDENKWSVLAEQVRSVLKGYPKLKLTHGRKVIEIRPAIEWDKGKAVEFLLKSLGYANSDDVLPVYIGDDQTDEDAFKMLRDRGQGVGIIVSRVPKETDASYSLQDPSEVMHFLRRLVEWKRNTRT